MTYNENIDRLAKTSQFNTTQANQFELDNARAINARRREDVAAVTKALSSFSQTLKDRREKFLKDEEEAGELLAEQHRTEDAERKLTLEAGIQELEGLEERSKIQDIKLHTMKQEMLKLSGSSVYPDAVRLENLSEHKAVGYLTSKLKTVNPRIPLMFNQRMANSTEYYSVNGVKFNLRGLKDNPNAYQLREAVATTELNKLKKELGLNEFTDEMLGLAGTTNALNKARESYLTKERTRYSIAKSKQTRAQHTALWSVAGPGGSKQINDLKKMTPDQAKTLGLDLYQYIAAAGGTIDENTDPMQWQGGLNFVFNTLADEGAAINAPDYADHIGNLPLPDLMIKQYNLKPGTTFADKWPERFKNLKVEIKKRYKAIVDAESAYQDAQKVGITNGIQNDIQNGKITNKAELNERIKAYDDIGTNIPDEVEDIRFAFDRSLTDDQTAITNLRSIQDGKIYTWQLRKFNPQAVPVELWEKARGFDDSVLKIGEAEELIVGALNETIPNMGIKGNEKNTVFKEAKKNALKDYKKKFFIYKGFGHSDDVASYYALQGQPNEGVDNEGNPLKGDMGVFTEIMKNGTKSKYTQQAWDTRNTRRPSAERVLYINQARQQIKETDGSAIVDTTLGGSYGKRQLQKIMDNIEKYGMQGLYVDEQALQFYKGMAETLDFEQTGGWWGVLDAQLKHVKHDGLTYANKRPKSITLFTGKDDTGKPLDNSQGEQEVINSVSRNLKHQSFNTRYFIWKTMMDQNNLGGLSEWDRAENLNPYLVMGGV